MDLTNKHITVVGLGRSGISVVRFLTKQGAHVIVTDSKQADAFGDRIITLKNMGARLELGGHNQETFTQADLIVISPGVPHTIGPVQAAMRKGVPLVGEVELAYAFIQTPIVAITGTNGKTTTTELTGKMLVQSGKKVFVGGNIGTPLIDYINENSMDEVIIAEISSFQTDTMNKFNPRVGVLLNLAEDHMDRYPDFNAYARSKARLFKNQGPEDTAVYNAADPLIRELCRGLKSRKLGFCDISDDSQSGTAAALIGKDHIRIFIPEETSGSIDLTRTELIGRHNRENIAAAALAALASGGTLSGIQSAVDQFKGLPHRMEPVASINQVRYINDSKGTNVDAVIRALECFDKPVILIMGGLNKGNDFSTMADAVRQHVKKLVVIGKAADEILGVLKEACPGGHIRAASMADAVIKSADNAEPGDTVMLSPGCASFDMYDNYAQRGDDFRQLVKELAR